LTWINRHGSDEAATLQGPNPGDASRVRGSYD